VLPFFALDEQVSSPATTYVLVKNSATLTTGLEHCAQKWVPVLRKNNATTQDLRAFYLLD
jgi:hypothetical protein